MHPHTHRERLATSTSPLSATILATGPRQRANSHNQQSAQQWFNKDWYERAHKTYGSNPNTEWVSTPLWLPTKVASNRIDVIRP
jgi:hypothetical protein